jgi:predicted small metal-binding protein
MKKIACNAVVPGCPFTTTAASEKELLEQVAAHARDAHGVDKVDPALLEKVKRAIHDEK